MKKKIVILGGGIAGFEFLSRITKIIDHNKYQLYLIDKNEFHIWKPMLHTFAAGSQSPEEQGISFLTQAKKSNFIFIPGEVSEIEFTTKNISLATYLDNNNNIILPARDISYDYLIIALGSKANDFNTAGVKEYAWMVDDLKTALAFKDHLKNSIIQAAFLQKKHHLTIIGAGATGIELSGEIISQINEASNYADFDFSSCLNVTIIDSGEKVLSTFPSKISDSVQEVMNKIGVNLILSKRVMEVTKNSIVLNDGSTIETDQVVWTTGIKAPKILDSLNNIEKSNKSQIIVNTKLQSIQYPNVFVIGDSSSIKAGELPATAQVATQQATYLSKYFERIIDNCCNVPEFQFKNKGSIVTVGRYASFGVFDKNIPIKGMAAKFAHLALYRQHQLQIKGKFRGLCSIIADYFLSKSRK